MIDPYLDWLGIPPSQQPPNHYQLLGIAPHEAERQVIEEAMLRQTARLRVFQLGPHALECTRLLNEVSRARITLLDPVKRREYDLSLAPTAVPPEEPSPVSPPLPIAAVQPAPVAAPAPVPVAVPFLPPPSSAVEVQDRPLAYVSPSFERSVRTRRQGRRWLLIGGGLLLPAASVIGAIVLFFLKLNLEKREAGTHAEQDRPVAQAALARPPQQPASEPNPRSRPEFRPATKTEPTPAPKPEPAPRPEKIPRVEPASPAKAGKLPVPDQAVQLRAEKDIKETYGADYAKHRPADMRALAAKLLGQAADPKEESASRFVLLREARDLAAQAGDSNRTLEAIDALSRLFALDDLLDMKTTALETAGRFATSPAACSALVENALEVVEEAVAADDFDRSLRLLKTAEAAAPKTDHGRLVAVVRAWRNELPAWRKQYEQAQEAALVLQEDLADPEANLVRGRYPCFIKEQWDLGLPYLALGSDGRLRELAGKELTRPLSPAELAELGDLWRRHADREQGLAKLHTLRHAHDCCQRALPDLTGVARAKAAKTSADLERVPFLKRPTRVPKEPARVSRAE
jgi:hypothetical protein